MHICPRGVLESEFPGSLGRFDSGIPNVVLLLSALAGWDSDSSTPLGQTCTLRQPRNLYCGYEVIVQVMW